MCPDTCDIAPEFNSIKEHTKISYGCDAVAHDSQNHST